MILHLSISDVMKVSYDVAALTPEMFDVMKDEKVIVESLVYKDKDSLKQVPSFVQSG